MNALQLLQWLTRLCVPHVNLGVLAQLPAGCQRAASDVFLRVGLDEVSEQLKVAEVIKDISVTIAAV